MKTRTFPICFLILILLFTPGATFVGPGSMFSGVGRVNAPGGTTSVGWSDDFNRADSDSLGANWTEIGDIDIVSNEANSPATFDFSSRGAAYTGTSVGIVQYVKVTLTGAATGRPGVCLRYTDGSSPMYGMEFDDVNEVARWEHYNTPAGTRTEIATTGLTVTFPMTVGVTITGTGNNTIVRIWVNPTNLPTAADNWDGDATPDVTFTDNPSSAVDTGNFCGLYGVGSGGALQWDDAFGGGL